MNEDKVFPLQMAAQECNNIYTAEMIEITERTILALLKFKLDIPTAIDFLQFFLYLTISEEMVGETEALL